ncbi:MAG: anaerobic ribonucleoside-triphosphate reductase activating protein [Firmicutes bacterium]|nr:anaerobic ribonucleoside-triphosphate reductase activating protein [Candidatus Colimorpha enterica]
MDIRGFQKLTLLDFPGHTACTVFTGGCNMRCQYCHNSDLVKYFNEYPQIDEQVVFDYLSKRKGIIAGVCVTGGEPMLMKDLPEFISKIKSLGYLVKIDTNGTFPNELKYIIDNGLCDYVAMDVKNSKEKYGLTIGRENFDISNVLKSIEILRSSHIDHEFRTTTCKTLHTIEDLKGILDMIGHDSKYYIQAYRDSEKVMDRTIEGYLPSELTVIVEELKKINPNVCVRGL